ncbi:MAG: hypothetical protein IT427_03840 [Pirellulales bacterium]|nr:hypothetical protein [Pirellulales bacterium]
MARIDTNAVLNRLLVTLHRSFPMYLGDTAALWTHPGDESAKLTVALIATDYRNYAHRLVELLLERRALAGFGEYPMAFTDTHDLALGYLVGELSFYQRQDIAAIEQCVADLISDPQGRALAEEILGNARGHLESLQELNQEPVAA